MTDVGVMHAAYPVPQPLVVRVAREPAAASDELVSFVFTVVEEPLVQDPMVNSMIAVAEKTEIVLNIVAPVRGIDKKEC